MKSAVSDFNFPKGLAIAILAGLMSGCFNVGLEFGKDINFGADTPDMFKTLPATMLVTFGGLITNAILMTLSFCILMALNVTFSNVWGIILKEWAGCNKKTIAVLILGIAILVFSTFLPQMI